MLKAVIIDSKNNDGVIERTMKLDKQYEQRACDKIAEMIIRDAMWMDSNHVR